MTIQKRSFIAAAVALSFLAASSLSAAQAETLNFTPAKFNQMVKSKKPFLLGVHTSWCSTCAAQKRVISGLQSQGAPYKEMTVLEMDWDKYRGSAIGKQLRIPRRSTLIMYGKGKEVGRIIAGTSSTSIKRLIDKGV